MANAKIVLECPNCKHHQNVENKYDHNPNDLVVCSVCGFSVARYCWTYICNQLDLPKKDLPYGASFADYDKNYSPNCICDSNVPYEMW